MDLSEVDRGTFIGLMLGQASFGGDGKQPQITLRMHVRHESLFRWLVAHFPASKLYGPYYHGGRSYYQWVARGRVLVRDVLPILEDGLRPDLDSYASGRLHEMIDRYASFIARERLRAGLGAEAGRHPPLDPPAGEAGGPGA